jgi:predicted RNA-binding Zn-ribbon protein involved in translation (DUF1610 family)
MSLKQKEQATLQVQPQAALDEEHSTCKCPKCGEALTEVKVYCKEENSYDVSLGNNSYGKEFLDWDLQDVEYGTCESSDVICPECKELLFTIKGDSSDSEDLKEFLRTGEVPVDREEHGVPIE